MLIQLDDDDESVIRLCIQLYSLLGCYSYNEELVKKSKMLVEQYLVDISSMLNGIVRIVLSVIIMGLDVDFVWFDCIMKVFVDSKLFNVKNMLLYFMGYEDLVMINKLFDLVLIDNVILVNIISMLGSVRCNLDD